MVTDMANMVNIFILTQSVFYPGAQSGVRGSGLPYELCPETAPKVL